MPVLRTPVERLLFSFATLKTYAVRFLLGVALVGSCILSSHAFNVYQWYLPPFSCYADPFPSCTSVGCHGQAKIWRFPPETIYSLVSCFNSSWRPYWITSSPTVTVCGPISPILSHGIASSPPPLRLLVPHSVFPRPCLIVGL